MEEALPTLAGAFAMPFDRESGADVERTLDPNTRSGRRCIFYRGGGAIRRSTVFPENFGDGPYHLSWLGLTHVHVICIGEEVGEFNLREVGGAS